MMQIRTRLENHQSRSGLNGIWASQTLVINVPHIDKRELNLCVLNWLCPADKKHFWKVLLANQESSTDCPLPAQPLQFSGQLSAASSRRECAGADQSAEDLPNWLDFKRKKRCKPLLDARKEKEAKKRKENEVQFLIVSMLEEKVGGYFYNIFFKDYRPIYL